MKPSKSAKKRQEHSSLLDTHRDISCPSHPHLLSYLHTAPCSCKCKNFLLPNYTRSHEDLVDLDRFPFWSQERLITRHNMLGLFLHSPIFTPLSKVTPCYGDNGASLSPSPLFNLADIESQQTGTELDRRRRRRYGWGLVARMEKNDPP